jgi:hypothetical protein
MQIAILVAAAVIILSFMPMYNGYPTTNEEEMNNGEENRQEEEDKNTDTLEPSPPPYQYKQDISDKALDLFIANKINNTEYRMILCSELLKRADGTPDMLISCYSIFDSDNTIGNENESFYEQIDKIVSGLLARS